MFQFGCGYGFGSVEEVEGHNLVAQDFYHLVLLESEDEFPGLVFVTLSILMRSKCVREFCVIAEVALLSDHCLEVGFGVNGHQDVVSLACFKREIF